MAYRIKGRSSSPPDEWESERRREGVHEDFVEVDQRSGQKPSVVFRVGDTNEEQPQAGQEEQDRGVVLGDGQHAVEPAFFLRAYSALGVRVNRRDHSENPEDRD